MLLAMKRMMEDGQLAELPVTGYVSAISVGIVEDEPILDLCYEEDSRAMIDMNVVMTDKGEFIEIQGTGEERPFKRSELDELLKLAEEGCRKLHQMQEEIIND